MAIWESIPERLAYRIGRRLKTAGTVLCFHSVTSSRLPASATIHVPVDHLRRTIEMARTLGQIVPLRELVDRHAKGQTTVGLFAFTFDDAYAALTTEAGSVFQDEQIPATIFVVSGAAATRGKYWWDRLEDAAQRSPISRWRQFERDCGLLDPGNGDAVDFWRLRRWVLTEHRGRWPAVLEPVLQALEDQVGGTLHRSMSFDEIASFVRRGPLDIGVHTTTHPVLPLLSETEARVEIEECAAALRERFDVFVPILAAPYGFFDRRTVDLARDLGMSATLTVEGRTLLGSGPSDGLPRICMLNGQKPWKTILSISGTKDRLRNRGRPSAPSALP